jgi:hypothetical protein
MRRGCCRAAEEHHPRSMPRAMPPCGGAPYCSASSRKPNRSLAVAGVDAQQANTFCCTLIVDPNRAAARFVAVDHQVVRHARPCPGRCPAADVLRPRGGERMVHAAQRFSSAPVLEHRELDDPREVHRFGSYSFSSAPAACAGVVQRLAGDLPTVGHEEQQVARLGLHPLGDLRASSSSVKFLAIGDQSLPSARRGTTPALGAEILLDELGQLVDQLAASRTRRRAGR